MSAPTAAASATEKIILKTQEDDLLTLFTDFANDKYGRLTPCETRSAILNRSDPNRWVLIDKVPFVLFISLPGDIPIDALRQVMINSHAYMNFIHPYYGDTESGNGDTTYQKKGFLNRVLENKNVSDDIKGMLGTIDERNTHLMKRYMALKRPPREKKTPTYYYGHTNDGQEAWQQQQQGEEEISSFEEDDFAIATGYEEPWEALQRRETLNELAKIKDEKKRLEEAKSLGITFSGDVMEEPFLMPLPLTASGAIPPEFLQEKQYRIVFRNHMTLHYFVNRFMRKPVIFPTADKSEGHPVCIKVLSYEHDPKGNYSLRPLYRLFKDRPIQYVENQLYAYKKNGATRHTLSFEHPSKPLSIGLLHPSHCDFQQQAGHLFVRNKPEQMDGQKKAMCGGNERDKVDRGISYQTLYIDFADILESRHAKEIRRVCFSDRKFSIMAFSPKIDKNNKKPGTKLRKFDPNRLFFCREDDEEEEEEEEEVVKDTGKEIQQSETKDMDGEEEEEEEIAKKKQQPKILVAKKDTPLEERPVVKGKAEKIVYGPPKPKTCSITKFTQKMPTEELHGPVFLQRSTAVVVVPKPVHTPAKTTTKKRQAVKAGPMDLFASKKPRID